jgi:hypothetical protein
MTTFAAAEKAMLAEVYDRIIDLVPEREPEIRFRKRQNPERELKTVDKNKMTARTVEIGAARKGLNRYVGYDARAYWYRYPVVIQYPSLGQKWTNAAASDAERITHDLLRNPTALAGVQNRRIDPEEEQLIEHDTDDPWLSLEMTLLVLYEISGT